MMKTYIVGIDRGQAGGDAVRVSSKVDPRMIGGTTLWPVRIEGKERLLNLRYVVVIEEVVNG